MLKNIGNLSKKQKKMHAELNTKYAEKGNLGIGPNIPGTSSSTSVQ